VVVAFDDEAVISHVLSNGCSFLTMAVRSAIAVLLFVGAIIVAGEH
jgi:hypothetical protein